MVSGLVTRSAGLGVAAHARPVAGKKTQALGLKSSRKVHFATARGLGPVAVGPYTTPTTIQNVGSSISSASSVFFSMARGPSTPLSLVLTSWPAISAAGRDREYSLPGGQDNHDEQNQDDVRGSIKLRYKPTTRLSH